MNTVVFNSVPLFLRFIASNKSSSHVVKCGIAEVARKTIKESNEQGWGCEDIPCEWSIFSSGADNVGMEKPGGLTTIHNQEDWQKAEDDRFDRDEVELNDITLVRPSPFGQKNFSKPGLGNDYNFYLSAFNRWRVKPQVIDDRRIRMAYERGKPPDQLAIQNDEEFRLTNENNTKESQRTHFTGHGTEGEAGLIPKGEEDLVSQEGYPGVDEMHIENDDHHVGGQRAGKALGDEGSTPTPKQPEKPKQEKPSSTEQPTPQQMQGVSESPTSPPPEEPPSDDQTPESTLVKPQQQPEVNLLSSFTNNEVPEANLVDTLEQNPMYQSFVQEAANRPTDPAPLLIFADWLEENGADRVANNIRTWEYVSDEASNNIRWDERHYTRDIPPLIPTGPIRGLYLLSLFSIIRNRFPFITDDDPVYPSLNGAVVDTKMLLLGLPHQIPSGDYWNANRNMQDLQDAIRWERRELTDGTIIEEPASHRDNYLAQANWLLARIGNFFLFLELRKDPNLIWALDIDTELDQTIKNLTFFTTSQTEEETRGVADMLRLRRMIASAGFTLAQGIDKASRGRKSFTEWRKKSAFNHICPDGTRMPLGHSSGCAGHQANSFDGVVDINNEAPWGGYPDYAPVTGLDTREPKDREEPIVGRERLVDKVKQEGKQLPVCPSGEVMSPNVQSCGGDEGWKAWDLKCPDGTLMSPNTGDCSGREGFLPFTEEERLQHTLSEPPKPGLQEVPSEGPLVGRYPTNEDGPIPSAVRPSPFGKKVLDQQGGEIPPPSEMEAAQEFDFVTLPEDVDGTNCGNCIWVREHGKGHMCGHPKLKGLPVNERNCCALWDGDGTLRAWEKAFDYSNEIFHPDIDKYRSIEGIDPQARPQSYGDSAGALHKAMSALNTLTGGALIAPPEFRGIKPKKKLTGQPGETGAQLSPAHFPSSSFNESQVDWNYDPLRVLTSAKALPPVQHGHQPTLAVDVDGTLCDTPPHHHDQPPSLKEMHPREGAPEAMRHFYNSGWKIVIWTCRDDLTEIEEWLNLHDIPYHEINTNSDQPTQSPKVIANYYIDDRSIRPDDWKEVVAEIDDAHKPRQPLNSGAGYEELSQLGEQGRHELKKFLRKLHFPIIPLEKLEQKLFKPGGVIILAPLKGQERAQEKVDTDYEGDWTRLLDMVRATVAVDQFHDIEDVKRSLSSILDKEGATIVREKDRFSNPLPSGYRDYLLNVRLPSGLICEIQLHVKPILFAREKERLAYDVVRTVKAALKEEGREEMTGGETAAIQHAQNVSRQLFDQAWQQAIKKRKHKKALPFGDKPKAPEVEPSPWEHWHKHLVKAGPPTPGYTGEFRDVLGRRTCYAGGRKVPCAKPQGIPQPSETEKPDMPLYEMTEAPSPPHGRDAATKIEPKKPGEKILWAVIFNGEGQLLVKQDAPYGGFIWSGEKQDLKSDLEKKTGLKLRTVGRAGDSPEEGQGYFIFQASGEKDADTMA